MSSPEPGEFGPYEQTLLEVARTSIENGLRTGQALEVNPSDFAPALRSLRASFVTLHIERALHGCMGSLEAKQPLVTDVAANAFGAAFRDPRFEAISEHQLELLTLHVSVLSPLERLDVDSEASLITQVRPKIDGVLLREGAKLGTFLPGVWESIPDPRTFLRELKRKAGLPADYWSNTLEVYRYTTESIGQLAPRRAL
jgi:AmmeMemoRadiSam system protein A